jgi:hypothetical protein
VAPAAAGFGELRDGMGIGRSLPTSCRAAPLRSPGEGPSRARLAEASRWRLPRVSPGEWFSAARRSAAAVWAVADAIADGNGYWATIATNAMIQRAGACILDSYLNTKRVR